MIQHVEKWMTREVVSTGPDEPLYAGVELMAESEIRHVLVLEAGEIVGILSNRDIIRASMASSSRRLDLHGTKVRDVMTEGPLWTVAPTAPLSEAARAFLEHRINALPVLDASEKLVGIITSDDVLRAVSLTDQPLSRPDL